MDDVPRTSWHLKLYRTPFSFFILLVSQNDWLCGNFKWIVNVLKIVWLTAPGFSAQPVLPAFCRLAFDFAKSDQIFGFDENLVAFCRLECFAWFTFSLADGHFASLKLNQRGETFSFPSYFCWTERLEILEPPQMRLSSPTANHGVVSVREFR